ncbi:MAG: class I SAM-dependent methyltransferase [Dehalococcoidia bacterium]
MTADRFDGTAANYARYRPRYSEAVYDALAAAFALDGSGRLLDVGCGAGQIAIALRNRFEAATGIDLNAEMIAEATLQEQAASVDPIEWHAMAAEEIDEALGSFRLVTVSDALHWMDQDAVMARCHARLEPGGGIALLTVGASIGMVAVDEPWQQTVKATIEAWLGPRRRAGGSYYDQPQRSDEAILAHAGFVDVTEGSHRYELDWDCDHLLGYLYSTSYANPGLLGVDREAFEADLRERLLRLEPSGRFACTLESSWLFGRRR